MYFLLYSFHTISCSLLNCFGVCTDYESIQSSPQQNDVQIDGKNDFLLNFLIVNSINMILLNHNAPLEFIEKRALEIKKILENEEKYKEKKTEIYKFWRRENRTEMILDDQFYYLGLILKKKLIMKFYEETNPHLQRLSSRFYDLSKETDFIAEKERKAYTFIERNLIKDTSIDFARVFEERKLERSYFEYYNNENNYFEEFAFTAKVYYDSCIQNEFYAIPEKESPIKAVLTKLNSKLESLMKKMYINKVLLKILIDIFHGNDILYYISTEDQSFYTYNNLLDTNQRIGFFIDNFVNHLYFILKEKFEGLSFPKCKKKLKFKGIDILLKFLLNQ
ncbi:hypothetical protein CWI39_2133p0010 [Hamiltosporidium magnivora]|uniref:Uncharacterized protein n=1 Tax=Hamiltosporidium magnivora TaxID=148818 RepID=A0A4Q9KXK5_9MICR|nr:hypothetical protein CWI39_2133p0010 [Hamiltosporidium magnivora]